MERSIQKLCEETAILRSRWDRLRPRLDHNLRRLHTTLDDYLKLASKTDEESEALKLAMHHFQGTRVHGRNIREVFSKRKPN